MIDFAWWPLDRLGTVNLDAPGSDHEVWLFDLDGCLVDSFAATHVRPLAHEALHAVRGAGARVVLWSAGGADYAERVAGRVGIATHFHGFRSKDRGADGRWTLDVGVPSSRVTCVDDQPDGLPQHVRTIALFPYIGVNPHDRALQRVIDAVDAIGVD